MIKFKEVYQKNTGHYGIREIAINPDHVVAFREDEGAVKALNENKMPDGLSKQAGFTRIYLNSGQMNLDVIVAESTDSVSARLNNIKKLLKG